MKAALPAQIYPLVMLLWAMMPVPADAAPPDAGTVAAPDDETLIREFWTLAGRKPAAQELDRHLAANPRLIKASARQYGPTLMWLLEYDEVDGVQALLRAGAMVPEGALALAARGNHTDLMELFIKRGSHDDAESTGLQLAAKYGNVKALQLLIKSGAKLGGAAKNDGFTALHQAVMERRDEAVRVLIAAKAPLEARDHNGRTPLGWGPFAYAPQAKHMYEKLGGPHGTIWVDAGEAKAMRLLLQAGARVDAADNEGNTPLHEAAIHGSIRGATELVAHGAKANVKNRKGETPLSIAKARNMTALVELLQKK